MINIYSVNIIELFNYYAYNTLNNFIGSDFNH